MDRRLDNFEILFCRAEDQIKVTERIEVSEIAALPRQHLVILAQKNLGAAQRVGEAGVDEVAEKIGKEAVGDEIERTHRLVFHRVDKASAVDEFGLAGL